MSSLSKGQVLCHQKAHRSPHSSTVPGTQACATDRNAIPYTRAVLKALRTSLPQAFACPGSSAYVPCLPSYPSIYPPVHPSPCPSIYPSVLPPTCPPVCPSIQYLLNTYNVSGTVLGAKNTTGNELDNVTALAVCMCSNGTDEMHAIQCQNVKWGRACEETVVLFWRTAMEGLSTG